MRKLFFKLFFFTRKKLLYQKIIILSMTDGYIKPQAAGEERGLKFKNFI